MSYKKLLSISNGFIQELKKYGKIYSICQERFSFIDDFSLARCDQKLFGCHHCLILVVLCTIISGLNIAAFRKNIKLHISAQKDTKAVPRMAGRKWNNERECFESMYGRKKSLSNKKRLMSTYGQRGSLLRSSVR